MKNIFFIFILVGIISSNASLAACENELQNFSVKFPTGYGNRRNYELTNSYVNMTISMKYRNMNNTRMHALYNALDEAGYSGGVIAFSVRDNVCNHLYDYQLPVGFGGSYTNVALSDVLLITRTR